MTREKFPVARLLYIGVSVLGMPEADVWHATIRKLMILFTEHLKYTGNYKKPQTIDDIIPF